MRVNGPEASCFRERDIGLIYIIDRPKVDYMDLTFVRRRAFELPLAS